MLGEHQRSPSPIGPLPFEAPPLSGFWGWRHILFSQFAGKVRKVACLLDAASADWRPGDGDEITLRYFGVPPVISIRNFG